MKVETLGRYRILGELGRGGCGVVYRALDPSIGRMVAIKTILPKTDVSSGQETRERFRREARSAGNLSHPNIVTVHDFSDTGDPMFIAMEFVEGRTLAEKMSSGPLDLDFIRSVLRSAADALDYAHSHMIVHRDVKPANFLITTAGRLKITDFGIAKMLDSEEGLTSTGMLVGTAQYMSPEQVSEGQVTGRSDQFSLGVIAYEMLTGVKPFRGNSWASIIHAIIMAEPPLVQQHRAALGQGVDAVLRKALAKDPAARFGSCTQFFEALDLAINQTPTVHTAILPRPPAPPPPAQVETTTQIFQAPPTQTQLPQTPPGPSATREVPAPAPKSLLKPILLGATGGVVIAAGLWFSLRPKPVVPAAPVVTAPAVPATQSPQSTPKEPVAVHEPEVKRAPTETSPKQAKKAVEVAPARPTPVEPKVEIPTPPPIVVPAPVIPAPVAPKPQEDQSKRIAEDQARRAAAEEQRRQAEEQAKRLVDEQTKKAAAEQAAARQLAEDQARNARAAESAAISRALTVYQSAYERKDVTALQRIWPTIPKQSLEGIRSSFRDASEVSMDLRPVGDPVIAGGTATVICDRKLHQVILKRTLEATGRVRIVLNRAGAGWVIQSVEQIN
jgi:serine/threonine-protein kinase